MDDADHDEGYPQDQSGALVEERRRKRREPEVSVKMKQKRGASGGGNVGWNDSEKEMEKNP